MKNVKRFLDFVVAFILVMVVLCSVSFASEIKYTENLIPIMTSNTAPSGVASASSIFSSTYPAWKAFNHTFNSSSDAWASNSESGQLEYNFLDAKCISKYTITSRKPVYAIGELPKNWTFEGWDDQLKKWVVLDIRQNITDWIVGVKKEFTISNTTYYNKYRINITANGGTGVVVIGELEMMESIILENITPTNLTATTDNAEVDLSWDSIIDASSYNIKRSTVAGGPYTTIATISETTYTDTTAVNGNTYYYVVSAVSSSNVESANSDEVSAIYINPAVNLEVTSVDKANVGDEITANILIHNAVNICAEDIKIAFDTSKLEFISAEGADGIKIYKEDDLTDGIRRYITASLGKANAANGDKTLLKLTFKAKVSGEAKIDITNGRIADNATLEKDIEEENCGEKIILIEGNLKDVNRSGQFTLLDLGINAWYFGDAAADTDTSKYDTDVVKNGIIDDDDLTEIVKQILNNSNYPAATKG